MTGVQLPGVLDDVYAGARQRTLGPVWTRGRPSLALWAPTAKSVSLLLTTGRHRAPDRDAPRPRRRVVGRRQPELAQRRVPLRGAGLCAQHPAVVTNLVTDPYSLGSRPPTLLARCWSTWPTTRWKPAGWDRLVKPRLPKPENSTIYELHVRDFSVSDATVPGAAPRHLPGVHSPAEQRHAAPASAGPVRVEHRPPAAGERHRLDRGGPLPATDARTAICRLIRPTARSSRRASRRSPARTPSTGATTRCTTPRPRARTRPTRRAPPRNRQFREMVAGLNRAGQRVVMDVVYNHTPAAGQDPKSILDRVVPGYYQRLNATTGQVETSTCCSNTATEHAMMEKLMIDSVLTWATDYKVDGFRFDLMGHQPKSSMIKIRRALDRLTLRRDGVDGRRIYLYGEGWNFGEVADNARFVQATQREMAGTGYGTFNDRLRDAVRGGGPFDENPRIQGFASGQFTDPNGDAVNGTAAEQRSDSLLNQDRIRVGLTGNLKNYRFVDRTGATVTGADVDYNGQPTGYTLDPQESVTYVEAHDNETLFDALTYKLPVATLDGRPDPDADAGVVDHRPRPGCLVLARGRRSAAEQVAGPEQLRLRRLVQRLRTSPTAQRFRPRTPPRADNESKWPYMRPLLANPALQPSSSRHPDGPVAGRRVAADPAEHTAVPSRHGAVGAAEALVPRRRTEPDARRDRHAHRRHARPGRRSHGCAGWSWCSTPRRRPRCRRCPPPKVRASACIRSRRPATTRSSGRRRTTAVRAPSPCRPGRSPSSSSADCSRAWLGPIRALRSSLSRFRTFETGEATSRRSSSSSVRSRRSTSPGQTRASRRHSP